MSSHWWQPRKTTLTTAAVGLIVFLVAGIASSQTVRFGSGDVPEAEFHLARMVYSTFGRAGSRGFGQPMWASGNPYAEIRFVPAP